MEIELGLCIKSIIGGAIIAVIVLLLPIGNPIISSVIVKSLISSGIYNATKKEEVALLTCAIISTLLLNTIKEVLDPALSGNEDLTAIKIAGYEWQCLHIPIFQQIKEVVESKIVGIMGGLIATFILINVIGINSSSLPITIMVVPLLLYKIVIINKTINTDIKIKCFLYLLLSTIVLKILISTGCSESIIVIVYAFFFIPAILQQMVTVKWIKKQ